MNDVMDSLEPHLSDERALALNATNNAYTVKDFMTKKGLLFDTLRRMGTDGAPVMTGIKDGAAKLFEKQKALVAPQSFHAVGIH